MAVLKIDISLLTNAKQTNGFLKTGIGRQHLGMISLLET